MIRRVRLLESDDTGTQQKLKVRGLRSDEPADVVSLERWGETGVAPANAEGIMLSLGGRSDRAFILGLAHQDHRPKNTEAGGKVFYDANGSKITMIKGSTTIEHASQIVLKVGGCTLTISASGFAFTGGTITHDGHLIDKTHVHTGVTPGGGLSSIPP
jgi:phage gp45-like